MNIYLINMLIPLFILVPNFLYAYLKPRDAPKNVRINPLLSISEKAGQASMIILPLIFMLHVNTILLCLMSIALVGYYVLWVRYFRTRKAKLLYSPLFFIPIPLAIFPVLYFLFSALMFNALPTYIAWLLFAVGHLYVSYRYSLSYKGVR